MIFLFSCQPKMEENVLSPLEKIKDQNVKVLLKKTFKKTGGFENWKNKKSIKFNKHFELSDSLGNTEMSVQQIHEYDYFPKKELKITWEKENKIHLLQSKDGTLLKTIEGKPDLTANPNSLKNTVLSSTFVANLPFNLLDEGFDLRHDGIDTLDTKEVVEVLRADFDPEQNDNHSSKDTWWLYFDIYKHHLVGYMVKHADHFSYVKNLSFTNVDGFLFPLKRKSWRVNQAREKLYLRAEYEYSGYQVGK